MKSFAKISLLFALVICGRYLQPAAFAPLATRPVRSAPALPLVLAHYGTVPQTARIPQPLAAQAKSDYFL